MKRIGVYLSIEPHSGGAFQYCQAIIEAMAHLPKDKYEVYALYAKPLWLKYLERYEFEKKPINISRFNYFVIYILQRLLCITGISLSKNKILYRTFDEVAKQLDSFCLDLIVFPAQEILPARVNTKSLATIHDLMHRYESRFPEVSANFRYKAREYLYSSICESAFGILVDSKIGEKQVIESYGKAFTDKIFVLPYTLPRYLYDYNDENEKSVVKKLPEKYFFYPAQFWQHKNHENLLLAASKLKNKGIDIEFIFAGSIKNGYSDIIRLIEKESMKNNVHILGYVSNEEMISLYKNARAMIMPTFFGPTNIPPLEGFALGCPVAVSRIYAMPEQVGDAALLFDPHNVDELADVLECLWTDDNLCLQLKSKGFEQIKKFTADKFNNQLKCIIESCLLEEEIY